MIMTYEEVCGNAWSTGENSSFSSWLSGELVLILPMKGSYLLNGEFSSQLTLGGGGWGCGRVVAFMPWTRGGVLP